MHKQFRSQQPGRLRIKLIVDILMTACLPGLMTYSFLGEKLHEWLGMALFFLFTLHHILNCSWLKGLGKGKYTPYRVFQTVIAALMFLCMFGSMLSGIRISQYLFLGWSHAAFDEKAVTIHISCAYWGFILMSMHIALHWRMIKGIMKNRMHIELPKPAGRVLSLLAACIAVYGAWIFYHNRIISYLFFKAHFVMYDFNATLYSVLLDYLAMMGFFIYITYYICGMLQKSSRRL